MSSTHADRIQKPDPEALPADLVELSEALNRLPVEHRRQILPQFTRVVESTKRRRRILALVQEALGQLRMDMKYLMFDLEATRRERDEMRPKGDENH